MIGMFRKLFGVDRKQHARRGDRSRKTLRQERKFRPTYEALEDRVVPTAVITGIIDGPRTGGLPKAVEIYTTTTTDFSTYSLVNINNGGTGVNGTTNLSSLGVVAAGQFRYISTEAPGFNAYFAPDGITTSVTGGSPNVNGDDVVQLRDGTTIIDQFGVVGVAPAVDTAWNYQDSFFYRNNNVGPNGGAFLLSDFTFPPGQSDALDSLGTSGTNPASGPQRFPVASFLFSTASADLAVTKSVNNNNVTTGTDVTFTVTVTNTGPDQTNGVVVTDLLPANFTYVSHTATEGLYTPGTGIWSGLDLNNAEAQTLTIVATAATVGTPTNTANITNDGSAADPNNANNSASAQVTITSAGNIDLSVSKTASSPSVASNGDVTYTVTVTNSASATATATAVSLTDLVPNNFGIPTNLIASEGTATVVTNTSNVSQVAATNAEILNDPAADTIGNTSGIRTFSGATSTLFFNIEGSLNGAFARFGVADFQFTANPNALALGASSLQLFEDEAGFSVDGDVEVFLAGSTASNLIDVTANPANGVPIYQGANDGFASIDPVFNAINTLLGSGTYANTTVGQSVDDLVIPLNSPLAKSAILEAIKTGGKLRLIVAPSATTSGVAATFAGQGNSDGAPPTLAVEVFQANDVTWSGISLAPGESATLTFVVNVGTVAGAATNYVQVTAAGQTDTDSAPNNGTPPTPVEDDEAAATITVLASADLSVTKTVSNPSPIAGSEVTYTVTVTNSGPDTATGVNLRDVLPNSYGNPTVVSASEGTVSTATRSTAATATAEILDDAEAGSTDTDNIGNSSGIRIFSGATSQNFFNIEGTANTDQNRFAVADFQFAADPTVTSVTNINLSLFEDEAGFSTSGPIQVYLATTAASLAANLIDATANPVAGQPSYQGANNGLAAIDPVFAPSALAGSANYTNSAINQNTDDLVIPLSDSVAQSILLAAIQTGGKVRLLVAPGNSTTAATFTGIGNSDGAPPTLTYDVTTAAGNDIAWNGLTLASGETATLVYTVNVGLATGNQTNSAEVVASDATDPDSTPNNGSTTEDDDAQVTINVQQSIDLSVTKIVSNPTPNASGTVTYTVSVTNSGTTTATGVTVTDLVPNSFGVPTTITPSEGAANLVNLTTNTSLTAVAFTTAEIKVSGASATDNNGNVSGIREFDEGTSTLFFNIEGDSNSDQERFAVADFQFAADPTITSVSNILLTLFEDEAGFSVGGSVQVYFAGNTAANLIDVNNNPATGVPSYQDGNNGLASIDPVFSPSGLIGSGTYTNANVGQSIDDLAISLTSPAGQAALLAALQTGTKFRLLVAPGDATVAATFAGLGNSDGPPPTLTFDVARSAYANDLEWSGVTLAPGETATLTYQVNVGTVAGTFQNYAQVSAATGGAGDPDSTPNNGVYPVATEDDEAAATVTITAGIDLSVSKTVSNPNPSPSGTVTYTITVTNSGSATPTATGVSLTDLVPDNFGTPGTFNASEGTASVQSGSGNRSTVASTNAEIKVSGSGSTDTQGNPSGIRVFNNETSTLFVNIAGSAYANVDPALDQQRFSVVDYTFTADPSVTAISNVQLKLFEDEAAFSVDGDFEIYLAAVTAANLIDDDNNPAAGTPTYLTGQNSTAAVDPAFGALTLIGAGSYANTTVGLSVDDVTINLNAAGQSAVQNAVINGGTLRLILVAAASTPGVNATFAGQANSDGPAPTITYTATASGNDVVWDGITLAPGESATLTYDVNVGSTTGSFTNFVEVSSADQADTDSTPGNGTPPTPDEDDEAAATVTIGSVPVLINEVSVNPPSSTDEPFEYLEILGGAGQTLSNTYLVFVEGEAGTSAGFADIVFNLSGVQLGSNGLLYVKAAAGGHTAEDPNTAVFTSSELNVATATGLENGSSSYVLIQSSTPIVQGTDLDTNDDGVLDLPGGAVILDAVAFVEDVGDFAYGGVQVTQAQGQPDAISRIRGNTTPLSASAWYNGDLFGTTNDSKIYEGPPRASANIPPGAVITPGAANYEASANGVITLSQATYSVTEGSLQVTLTVQRLGGSAGTVSVSYNTVDGTAVSPADYAGVPTPTPLASWGPGDTSTRTIVITIPNDSTPEADKTFSVVLSGATGGATIAPLGATATVTILDDDTAPTVLINEVLVNPPGTPDSTTEYLEVRSVTPSFALTNHWLLIIEGDSSTTKGQVDSAINLGSLSTGTNGLLLLGNNFGASNPWAAQTAAGTTVASFDLTPNTDIENGGVTFLLVTGFTGTAGTTDIDANDDGVIDNPAWTTILDSVGWRDAANDVVYSPAILTQSAGTTDAATRVRGDNRANTVGAWYSGDLLGATLTSTQYDPAEASANLPTNAVITPGADNFAQTILLNEIFVNPPSDPGDEVPPYREYVEIRSANGSVGLGDIWLLEIEGDAASGRGTVDMAVNLSGRSTGTNGLHFLATDPANTAWTALIAAATTTGTLPRNPITMENGTVTFLLVTNFTGSVGADYDADNNGVLDSTPWGTILDSVGWKESQTASHAVYAGAPVLTKATGTADAASRFFDNPTPNSGAAWYNGDIIDTAANPDVSRDYDPAASSANLPAGAILTPGDNNQAGDTVAPTVVITDNVSGGPVTVGTVITYTLQFSEAVTGVEVGDITNGGTAAGTFGNFTVVDPDTYTIQFTTTGAGTAILRINNAGVVIEDLAGNDLATPANDDTTITVNAAPTTLAVETFTPTQSGFEVKFTVAPDLSTINLFNLLETAGVEAADLTVTLGGNRVNGTLVPHPTDPTRFTWVGTGSSPLAAGTYTVTLRSDTTANGGIDDGWTNGTFGDLDGDGNGTAGGNYTNTFTVTNNNVWVSIDNVVLGPGQIQAGDPSYPGTANSGPTGAGAAVPTFQVPISIGEIPAGMDGVSFDLRYNPNLITIFSAGANGGTGGDVTADGIAAGFFSGLFTINPFFDTSDPNSYVARFGYAVNSAPAKATPTTFATFEVAVPAGANSHYFEKNLLDMFNLIVTAGSVVPSREDDAVHVNAYVGDANGDREILPADASLAIQIFAAGVTTTGFQNYPLIDPVLIGDANFDGQVLPQDATIVIQEFANPGSTAIPNRPAAGTSTPGLDPVLTIPTNIVAAPGGVASFPINIDFIDPSAINGVDGIGLVFSYNRSVFDGSTLSTSNITRGSVLSNNWIVGAVAVFNNNGELDPNDPNAHVVIGLFTTQNQNFTPGTAGSLINVPLSVRASAPLGAAQINLRANNAPYGTQETRITNGPTSLVFSPAPTNGANDQGTSTINGQTYVVDGTVTIQQAVNRVFVPTNLSGSAGSVVTAPVNIEVSGTFPGVDGIGLVLSYDNTVIDGTTLNTSNVLRGTYLSNNWIVGAVTVFNPTPGLGNDPGLEDPGMDPNTAHIVIGLFTTQNQDFTAGLGSLVTIPFQIRPTAPTGPSRINVRDDNSPVGTQETRITFGPNSIPLFPPPTNGNVDTNVDGVISINIQANQPPRNFVPGAQQVLFNTPLVLGGANAISVTDEDAEAGSVTTTLTVATAGTLTVPGSPAGVVITNNGGNTITLEGTTAAITAALDGLIFQPAVGFTGQATLTITTNDNGHSGFTGEPFQTQFGGLIDTRAVPVTVVGLYVSEVLIEDLAGENEYIEVYSTVPNYTIPAGVYFVGLEGDAAENRGAVTDTFDLGGFRTGANGYLVLAQRVQQYGSTPVADGTFLANTPSVGTGLTRNGFGNGASTGSGAGGVTVGPNTSRYETFEGSATFKTGVHRADQVNITLATTTPNRLTAGTGLATDLENASISWVLISGTLPAIGADFDAANDGTLTLPSGAILLDSVGTTDGGAGDTAYGRINFLSGGVGATPAGATNVTVAFTPSYVGRIGKSTGSAATAWVGGTLAGTAPNYTLASVSSAALAGAPLNHVAGPNLWLPTVSSVLVNSTDVDPQRSQVFSFTVNFTGLVDFTGGVDVDGNLLNVAANFTVTRVGGGTVDLGAVVDNSSGFSVVTLFIIGGTASPNGFDLADGRYVLTTIGSAITSGGNAIDAAGTGVPGSSRVDNFHRFFGDLDGNGKIEAGEWSAFLAANGSTSNDPNFNFAFDFDSDGDVDSGDEAEFYARLFTELD